MTGAFTLKDVPDTAVRRIEGRGTFATSPSRRAGGKLKPYAVPAPIRKRRAARELYVDALTQWDALIARTAAGTGDMAGRTGWRPGALLLDIEWLGASIRDGATARLLTRNRAACWKAAARMERQPAGNGRKQQSAPRPHGQRPPTVPGSRVRRAHRGDHARVDPRDGADEGTAAQRTGPHHPRTAAPSRPDRRGPVARRAAVGARRAIRGRVDRAVYSETRERCGGRCSSTWRPRRSTGPTRSGAHWSCNATRSNWWGRGR